MAFPIKRKAFEMKRLFAVILLSVMAAWNMPLSARDGLLRQMADGVKFDPASAPVYPGMSVRIIQRPDEKFKFLHDTMITEFKGSLYAAWYNCPEAECRVTSVIRGRSSDDGGKTWSGIIDMAADPDPSWQYVPPAFAQADGKLYLMVPRSRKDIQTFEIFRLDEASGKWTHVRSLDSDFLANTNGVRMDNGKMIVGGRHCKTNKPAMLIFDSGTPESGAWHIAEMDPEKSSPPSYACPEASLTVNGRQIQSYVRCSQMIAFWLYVSEDYGETWKQYHHEIPVAKSKLNSGRLSDGRSYLIFNARAFQRNRLFIAFTKPGETKFSEFYTLRADNDPALNATPQWSYPCSVEHDGNLYITCTCRDASPEYRDIVKSACALIVLPLNRKP